MSELFVRVAQGLERRRQRLEERLELRQVAGPGIGDGVREPGGDGGGHQNVTVPRRLIGIMWTLCSTGSVNRLTEYLKAMSKPSGPVVMPPPPSTK